ncbi:MAG: radical SAM protein [Halomonadaceae bacterium]|nr:MAG: radical SAM protein [Halomonadaceae bacterium]
MPALDTIPVKTLPAEKFRDPRFTLKGEPRATVGLKRLDTLWFLTGTLCNLTCENCYIESSPSNDRLVYLSTGEVAVYLDEIATEQLGTRTIAFTGGEPFMNPDLIPILEDCLARDFDVLVLTNAMRPMMKLSEELLALQHRHPGKITVRVSIDHYTREVHQQERGPRSWEPAVKGLHWLVSQGFTVDIAGRLFSDETDAQMRDGYARFFREEHIALDAHDPATLVLFPEMDEKEDVPEISTGCWSILGVSPDAQMCATSRMVVKRKGEAKPVVVPCTLLPYQKDFELGHSLKSSFQEVPLNHPHCARFCVLGGASCAG